MILMVVNLTKYLNITFQGHCGSCINIKFRISVSSVLSGLIRVPICREPNKVSSAILCWPTPCQLSTIAPELKRIHKLNMVVK